MAKLEQQREKVEDMVAAMPFTLRRTFIAAAVPVKLRAREVLFHAGDRGDGCYVVRRGAIKASVVAKDGQERLLAILGPGALIGELALFDDAPRSATITALRQCSLMHLTKATFFDLADDNPSIYRQALRLLAHRLRGSNDSVLAQGTVTVAGRVARAFASLAEGLGEEKGEGRILLPHRITQTDIAGMAGVARENASRAINDLLRQGILGRDGSFYVIEKMDELLDLSEI
ncbi:MAG: Crp/Fnr family transcriptional regulator [Rhizobiales bacterium]|nr:Crp/Fnr family transcriptional regulator [Hyphomicrobiales bacterium]MBI3674006.1 Crp/Fnr family transcriptional regulator [Hyphomicrobiales bacterium]